MPNVSIRLAVCATAFLLPGVLMAQTPASSAPAAQVPKPSSAPAGAKAADAANPAPSAGKAPASAAPAASPGREGTPRSSRRVRTGDAPKDASAAGGAKAAPANPGSAPGGAAAQNRGSRNEANAGKPKEVGMQRAFADLQTTGEFDAYKDKAKSVKTVGECKALMEETRKQLEPRAKAQQKPINVDIDKTCAIAKERRGLTG